MSTVDYQPFQKYVVDDAKRKWADFVAGASQDIGGGDYSASDPNRGLSDDQIYQKALGGLSPQDWLAKNGAGQTYDPTTNSVGTPNHTSDWELTPAMVAAMFFAPVAAAGLAGGAAAGGLGTGAAAGGLGATDLAGVGGIAGMGAGAPGFTAGLTGAGIGAAAMPDWSSLLEGTGISPEEMQALVGQSQSDIATGLAGSTGTASAGGASWMNQLQSLLNGGGTGSGLPSVPPGTSTVLQKLLSSGGSGISSLLGGGSNLGLLGGLLGALAGGVGANQKPAGTTTSVQDIPDYLKPYQSMNLTSGVNNFGLASQGASVLPGAANQMNATINGQYLDPNTNPAFQPYVKDLMGQAMSTFNGQYGGPAGTNLGNSGFQEGAARAITNAALPLYNSAYQTERGNQVNAASQAPAFASNYAGAALAPNLAFKNLYSGAQATTQPYFANTGAGIFSGGLAGYTLGNAFGK